MKKYLALLTLMVTATFSLFFSVSSKDSSIVTAAASKVYVCKYVGTPGTSETLQTGNNPIEVSENALPNGWSIGSYFNDQQGRSFVLATSPQNPEPDVDDCPQVSSPSPTVTATATVSATPVPTATATATATSTSTSRPCDGDCDPTSTPTATSQSTETPLTPICTGDQHLDASGRNCVSFSVPGSGSGTGSTVTGQVLGASTMAGTGMVEDAIFNSIFTLGSLLTSFGIMKNGKKIKN